MAQPTLAFQNYIFKERNDQLQITKKVDRNTKRFTQTLRQYPCRELKEKYSASLSQKLRELQEFNPKFLSSKASSAFIDWQKAKIAKMTAKLKVPLEALQNKVAKHVESLFASKGERFILLGCVHVQQGNLKQSQINACMPFPPFTHEKLETHVHSNAVCIDWRSDSQQQFTFEILGGLFKDDWTFPSISVNGPDFAHRCFANTLLMADFARVKNVKRIHAERVPYLEKGVMIDEHFNNTKLLKQIFYQLLPGGEYSFDVGCCPVLLVGNKRESSSFRSQCREKALQESQNNKSLFEKKMVEVRDDKDYWRVSELVISKGYIKGLFSFGLGIKHMCFEQECTRRKEETILTQFFKSSRMEAKEFTKNHPEKVLLSPDNIYLYFSIKTAYSLRRLREEGLEQIIENVTHLNPTNFEKLNVFVDTSLPFSEQFAIYRQLECYSALHVDSSLNVELLPQNKALLDEALRILLFVTAKQIEKLGFVNPSIELNVEHPDNGRLFSRIIRVQRPKDPAAKFKIPQFKQELDDLD